MITKLDFIFRNVGCPFARLTQKQIIFMLCLCIMHSHQNILFASISFILNIDVGLLLIEVQKGVEALRNTTKYNNIYFCNIWICLILSIMSQTLILVTYIGLWYIEMRNGDFYNMIQTNNQLKKIYILESLMSRNTTNQQNTYFRHMI